MMGPITKFYLDLKERNVKFLGMEDTKKHSEILYMSKIVTKLQFGFSKNANGI